MTLIAVAPVVLWPEVARACVPEREWVTLVVVVRLVVRQRVVELELDVRIEHPLQGERDTPVPRARRALERGQGAEAVTTREAGRPRLPERPVVAVDEPQQVVGAGVCSGN